MKLKIDQFIESIVSTDETRVVLGFLHIVENHPVLKGAAIEATDGRRYVAIPVTLEPDDIPGYIDPSLLADAREGHRKARAMTSGPRITVPRDTMSIKLRETQTETMDGIIRPRESGDTIGEYPSIRPILPRLKVDTDGDTKRLMKPSPIDTISLNAEYLGEMQQAMGAMGVQVIFYGEFESFEVEPNSLEGSGYGVLMPMRKG